MQVQHRADHSVRSSASGSASRGPGATQLRRQYHLDGVSLLAGMGEALVWEGAADASTFEAYIQQVLAPSLQRRQIVLLDNLSSHQGERVRQVIEACGCQVLFLPTYTPDFSPIERPSPN